MKKILKKCFVIFVLITTFAFTNVVSLSAKDESLKDLYHEISRSEVELGYNVKWTNIIAETQTTKPVGNVGGYGTSGSIQLNTWYGQQINLLEVPRTANSEKQAYEVVAWSIPGDQSWDFAGVTQMAGDFEKKNPGYIVLGGINGDFYDWHTTFDYPNSGNGIEMSNGEFLRSVHRSWGVVGVKNDSELNQLIFAESSNSLNISNNLYLSIYDELGNEIKCIELDGLNMSSLEEGQTSAYFGSLERVYKYTTDENGNQIPVLDKNNEHEIEQRIYHAPVLANGKAYFVIDGERVIYQAVENSYYGKGQITNVNDSSEVIENSFAIVTKNPEIESMLSEGITIRVQKKFIGEFEGIENALGCSHPLIEDGVFSPYYVAEDYYTTRAPRTIIGCKADGTICLLTMDGRNPKMNYYGTNQEEINVILQELEIDDAYLLDGGGSSTFFVRENNSFVVKNQPSDGDQRSVSNGFLIVGKVDQNVTTKSIESTQNSISIEVNANENAKKVYVDFEDKVYELKDNKITIDNLESNTNYSFIYLYEDSNGNLTNCTYFENYKTDKIKPEVSIKEAFVEEGALHLQLNINDAQSAIQLIFCEINGKRKPYPINNENDTNELIFNVPDGVEEFTCKIKVNYLLNEKEKTQSFELEYNHKPLEQEKGGCSTGNIYFISGLIACGCLLMLINKRK